LVDRDLMPLADVKERLALPQPIRIGELAQMTGLSAPTIRKLINLGTLVSVHTALKHERRVPVFEARRILTELSVI
jgi:plasmid maintenance system antidote protein VapI